MRLTKAGAVLLDASRAVLSLVDQEVNRTRQAAGLGRQRLRLVVPPGLPDTLAVEAASILKSAAAAADLEIVWIETPLDAEFSLIRQRRADAGLGWLTAGSEALPSPLDVMALADFQPDVWIPSSHVAARRGTISLADLAHMDVIHGPRRAEPGTYDAWTRVLRTVDPSFEFSDPPLRHSLQMNLAFAATADRPTAVLTGPSIIAGSRPRLIRLPRPAVTHEMVRVILEHRPLTATAALVWNGDLPRTLQQILFDTAESITSPGPARQVEPELKAMSLPVTYLGQALSACVHRRGSHQPTGVRVPLAPSSGARLPAGNRRLRAASASAQAARWSSRNCGRTASARKGARPYGRWADCSLICRLSATTPGATCVATSTVASIVSRRSGRMFAELERPL